MMVFSARLFDNVPLVSMILPSAANAPRVRMKAALGMPQYLESRASLRVIGPSFSYIKQRSVM